MNLFSQPTKQQVDFVYQLKCYIRNELFMLIQQYGYLQMERYDTQDNIHMVMKGEDDYELITVFDNDHIRQDFIHELLSLGSDRVIIQNDIVFHIHGYMIQCKLIDDVVQDDENERYVWKPQGSLYYLS